MAGGAAAAAAAVVDQRLIVQVVANRSRMKRRDCKDFIIVCSQHLAVNLQLLNHMVLRSESSETNPVHARVKDHLFVALVCGVRLKGSLGCALPFHIVNDGTIGLIIAIVVNMADDFKRIHLSSKADYSLMKSVRFSSFIAPSFPLSSLRLLSRRAIL